MVQISNRPHNPDGWEFHIQQKQICREALSKEKLTLSDLAAISIDAKFWKVDKGDPDKPNYQFLLKMNSEYEKFRKAHKHYEKKLSMKERIALNQCGKMLLALYKQDSAYYERIGGHVCVFLSNEEQWRKDKLTTLISFYNWWNTNDIRGYSKKWINNAWVTLIELYQEKEFIRMSVDWLMEYLYAHREEWVMDPEFHPDKWYPKGKGQITYLVSGRTD
jgi:hypothetical protein